MDVDDPGVDALGSQLLGGNAGLVDHQAGSHDGDVIALGDLLALAQLKVVGSLIVEHRHSQTAEAQVDGAFHGVGAGQMTVIPGMLRMRAKSSQHWWEAPSSPTEMPPWVAPILTLR